MSAMLRAAALPPAAAAMQTADLPIDIVVPFVDGNAAGYAAAHEELVGPRVPCQLRTLGELRYVLRSIAAHAPWVRRVHLAVFDAGHVPAFVNLETVRVAPHAMFIPAALRPTFHWSAICPFLHRIAGLAEHFIVLEDDCFLGRPSTPHVWFDGALPRTDLYDSPVIAPLPMFARSAGAYTAHCLATRRVLDDWLKPRGLGERVFGHYLYPHGPLPGTRALWQAMLRDLGEHSAVRATLQRRSRGDGIDQRDQYVLLDQLFCAYVERHVRPRMWRTRLRHCARLQLGRALTQLTGIGTLPYATYAVRNHLGQTRRQLRRLQRQRPQVFCINDEAYDRVSDAAGVWHTQWEVNPASSTALHATLQTLFPQPSKYERDTCP